MRSASFSHRRRSRVLTISSRSAIPYPRSGKSRSGSTYFSITGTPYFPNPTTDRRTPSYLGCERYRKLRSLRAVRELCATFRAKGTSRGVYTGWISGRTHDKTGTSPFVSICGVFPVGRIVDNRSVPRSRQPITLSTRDSPLDGRPGMICKRNTDDREKSSGLFCTDDAAELYMQRTRDPKSFPGERNAIERYFTENGAPALDIGCGVGRISTCFTSEDSTLSVSTSANRWWKRHGHCFPVSTSV